MYRHLQGFLILYWLGSCGSTYFSISLNCMGNSILTFLWHCQTKSNQISHEWYMKDPLQSFLILHLFRQLRLSPSNSCFWLAITQMWCSLKVLHKDFSFHADWSTNMAVRGNSCFWLVNFQKSSSLKLQGQMFWNFIGMMTGRSSTKIHHFVLIGWLTWRQWRHIGLHWTLWEITFSPSTLKLLYEFQSNFAWMMYGRSFTKIPHFVLIGQLTWPSEAILVSDWPIFKNLLLWNYKAKCSETL